MNIRDYIVVGSGCTGAMAAQTLAEAGADVTMLDAGLKDEKYNQLIPPGDFISIRKNDKDQYRYFLGDNLESIPWGEVGAGAQLTPPRKFMTALTEKFLPFLSENFRPVESLAFGGLGSGWGTGCNVFSAKELEVCGLNKEKMMEAYQVIADRIGLSGAADDAAPYTCSGLENIQQPSAIDTAASRLLKKYYSKKQKLNEQGFYIGRPALALLTSRREGRSQNPLHNMDFYSDKEKSAYRPWITVEGLVKKNNFTYIGNQLVLSFTEQRNTAEVRTLDISTGEKKIFTCKKLVLAGGVLGTARIVLRSFPHRDKKLPLLCNPYTYVPCLQPALSGTALRTGNTSFAQLVMFYDATKDNFNVCQASIYSYSSLLLFRLVKESPLNFRDGRILMQHLLPAVTIVGIHHPEKYFPGNGISLVADQSFPAGDKMKIAYVLSQEEKKIIDERERKYIKALRSLGCYSIKRVNPGLGSSIHYAGTLPFDENGKEFTLAPGGKLNGTRNIFVADGSGFSYLPAKGLTFSLMANAHNVALEALKHHE